MTIDECIDVLQDIKNRNPGEGGDIEVVLGVGFGKNGRVESISLQAEPSGGENEVVLETPFEGEQPTYPSAT